MGSLAGCMAIVDSLSDRDADSLLESVDRYIEAGLAPADAQRAAAVDFQAQVAADEPETEPKMPQPKMVVCIKRPGTLDSQGERPSNICSDNLVRYKISPIQMNMGRAASSQLDEVSQNDENRFFPGKVLVKNA